ncbi:MAG: hypothetical protein WC679_01600 [Bacteroidales bacterium]|jgi:hypothetical protein
MEIFILVVIMNGYNGNKVEFQEFQTKESCVYAAQEIKKEADTSLKFLCLHK